MLWFGRFQGVTLRGSRHWSWNDLQLLRARGEISTPRSMRGQVGKRSGLWFLLGVKEEECCDMLCKPPETWTISQRQVRKENSTEKRDRIAREIQRHLDTERFPFSRILSQY